MNAAQARKIAQGVNVSANDSQHADIMDMIKAAVSKGEFEIQIKSIRPDVQLKLISDGYKVDFQTERNESYVTIIW